MRRGRPKEDAAAKIIAKQLKLLADAGLMSGTEVAKAQEETYVARTGKKIEESLEGILISLSKPQAVMYIPCNNCGELFGTNYRYCFYCSDHCRIKDFETRTGMKWTNTKTDEQRWDGEPPLLISPEAIKKLIPWAKKLISASEAPEQAVVYTELPLPLSQEIPLVQEELDYSVAHTPDDKDAVPVSAPQKTIPQRSPAVLEILRKLGVVDA